MCKHATLHVNVKISH